MTKKLQDSINNTKELSRNMVEAAKNSEGAITESAATLKEMQAPDSSVSRTDKTVYRNARNFSEAKDRLTEVVNVTKNLDKYMDN